MKFILGKKLKMTRVYDEKGNVNPVTVLEVGPVYVTQVKEENGKLQVQVGYEQTKKLNKPETGHLKKNGQDKPLKHLHQFRVPVDQADQFKVGQELTAKDFASGDEVDITAISKGKGYAGVIKRHNFHRGPKTHGSDHHRAPGSIGSAYPQRVFKGRKLPGHLGQNKVTVKKMPILEVHPDKNLLVVKGPVPGATKTIVTIFGE